MEFICNWKIFANTTMYSLDMVMKSWFQIYFIKSQNIYY